MILMLVLYEDAGADILKDLQGLLNRILKKNEGLVFAREKKQIKDGVNIVESLVLEYSGTFVLGHSRTLLLFAHFTYVRSTSSRVRR